MREALGALFLVITTGCQGLNSPAPPSLSSHRLPPVRSKLDATLERISLYNRAGTITVHSSTEPELINHLTVCAETRKQALAWGETCQLVTSSDGHGKLSLRFDRNMDLPLERLGADLELRLPVHRALELRSRTGLIDTSSYIANELVVGTQSGTLRLGESRGQLRFTSNNGNIELLGSFREAEGRSESASLDVRHPEPGARLRFETISGLTVLRIPRKTPVLLTFRTLRGKLVPELPVQRERLSEPAPGHKGYSSWRIQIQGEGIAEGRVPFKAEISSESGALRLVRAAEIMTPDPAPQASSRAKPCLQ
ncbi:MAG: hypothetical protein CSA62_09950 [Planctomycetota bacterium]|nr:MAG: hypothetical protein CSA62_09950 [Planctomycetota bacterium]